VLADALTVVGLVLCSFVCVLATGDILLAVVHIRWSRQQIAAERHDTALRLPEDQLPLVCVQLPVFNEANQIEPALAALCALDWSRERLEIMVLDDSTDETPSVVARCVAKWCREGFAVSHVRRAHRQDFKAGALADGMKLTKAPYLAVFDADYRPQRSFLQATMAVLLSDTNLAFVQARLDYRNRERNLLTRAQALDLDTLLAYEQAARSWAGVPMTFNGTCGVWRRRAIEDAGGWSGDSLAEDQDLSFRAYALGWRSRYLVSVAAEGELPEQLDVLVTQRRRWSTGTAQTFRALPWRLLGGLRPSQAILFSLLTLFYATTAAVLVAALVIVVVSWAIRSPHVIELTIALIAAFAAVVIPKSIGAALGSLTLGRPVGVAFARDLLALWAMQAVLLPSGAAALMRGYFFRRLPFLRTPKNSP
jgi:cellulose synthase/poly-beta-1,6-N-acetylglucosamine synthase-like glycosyltransferase